MVKIKTTVRFKYISSLPKDQNNDVIDSLSFLHTTPMDRFYKLPQTTTFEQTPSFLQLSALPFDLSISDHISF